ncbi:hypothetical protein [Rosenbergiella australiborealis]|uniref:hypothetical protein n=1 Tax=Rosenbergiella australiborealis TaxID=1544696 RepID=UPI001F4DC6E5|nr:hypothetical protein [Rosenbergiella australiborealis]
MNNDFINTMQIEGIIGQTVLELLERKQSITLPYLLEALREHSTDDYAQQAEKLLKNAFTIQAA